MTDIVVTTNKSDGKGGVVRMKYENATYELTPGFLVITHANNKEKKRLKSLIALDIVVDITVELETLQ